MFRFFPSSFELRQKSFLWADDLSSYDSILDLPFTVPLGYGDHISLFTILMAIALIFTTRLSTEQMGDTNQQYPHKVQLRVKADLQIRHQALESARQTANRVLEKNIGKTGFRFTIKVYPHHILRENPIACGAGADRMSTGMQLSFGKPIGSAAQLRVGKVLMEVQVTSQTQIDVAKKALARAKTKVPCSCDIIVVKNEKAVA